LLDFREPDAPRIRFRFRANIRPTLACFPRELVLSDVDPERTVDGSFMVYHYGPDDWGDLRVQASAPWVTTKVRAVPKSPSARPTEPREAWRVILVCIPRLMPDPTGSSARIRVRAPSSPAETVALVTLHSTPAFRTVPSTLFFGTVERKSRTTRGVHVLIGSRTPNPTAINVSKLAVDIPCAVDLNAVQAEPRYCIIKATLVPQSSSPVDLRGTVSVAFSDGRSVSIPIRARVVASSDNKIEP
jgi:hypothetical protein